MVLVVFLALIIWSVILAVLARDFLWGLKFFEIKEYNPKRILNHIRWDFEYSNRGVLLTQVKFILFSITTLFLVSPIYGILGSGLIFAVWFYECIIILEKIISKRYNSSFKINLRSLLSFLLYIVFVVSIAVVLTTPFALITRPLFYGINVTESIFGSTGSYSDIYLYICFTVLTGLFLDLASPALTSIFVLITSPVTFIKNQIQLRLARIKLGKVRSKLTIITVTGSFGKSTVAELTRAVASKDINILCNLENYTSINSIAKTILKNLTNKTEVFIAEIGAFKKGEILKVNRFLKPEVVVLTNIEYEHTALFGDRENLIKAKSEILEGLPDESVAILNYSDPDVVAAAQNYNKKKIWISSDLKLEENNVKVLSPKGLYIENDNVKFTLSYGSESFEYSISRKLKNYFESVIFTVALCRVLGISPKNISERIEKIQSLKNEYEILKGDNNTFLIDHTGKKPSYTSLVNLAEWANSKKQYNQKILVTTGISELGKVKKEVYKRLALSFLGKISIVLSNNKTFLKSLKENNTGFELLEFSTTNDLVYKIRKCSKYNDIILLEGDLEPKIVAELASEV